MFELFLLGCTGVVIFLHGANFFFRALSHRLTRRSLSFLGVAECSFSTKVLVVCNYYLEDMNDSIRIHKQLEQSREKLELRSNEVFK